MDGEHLRLGAAELLEQAASVLQPWLSGASLASRNVAGAVSAEELRAFGARMEEELARARRFNLRLSLLLVDLGQDASDEGPIVARLQNEIRRELRGSDVLGRMRPHQLAALLIETDAEGTGAVAHRLKRRLLDAAESLNLSTITIGHAALSPTCHTADALVGHARRHAEPVIKH
jgi:GGDEF domain-containing protein